jgi:tetratricopeptide (TPR) repeat protein
MKLLPRYFLALVVLAGVVGCAKKQKEISDLDRKQAANLASEAQFAATIRDYGRAQGLFTQAAQLCPDTGAFWLSLGSMDMRLDKRGEARDAYQHALTAFQDAAKKDKTDPEPALQQLYVLALLGRVDEARTLQTKLLDRYPDNRAIRTFVDNKGLDNIVADPSFKTFAVEK